MKKLSAFICSVILFLCFSMTAIAKNSLEVLQCYFTDDGEALNIFVSGTVDENAEVIIGNEHYIPEISSDVEICTAFLIDNSNSIPEALRSPLIDAIKSYSLSMPKNESVKIISFDLDINDISGKYSKNMNEISNALSKIDFSGKSSRLYDAIIKTIEQNYTDSNVYYRMILISDGKASQGTYSFTYLKNFLEDNNRYQVDVVELSQNPSESENMKSIANINTSTYMHFYIGSNFDSLYSKEVTALKQELTNSLTSGGYIGVSVQNGNETISIGSMFFPQIDMKEQQGSNTNEEFSFLGMNMATLLIVVFAVVVLLGGGTVVLIVVLKKKNANCVVRVNIIKDDPNDRSCVGSAEWEFSKNAGFRVGRSLTPIDNNGMPLPRNQAEIFENANEEAMTSIGRNAFYLFYEPTNKRVKIQNVAQNATLMVIVGDRSKELKRGESYNLERGSQILIGTYTTIQVMDIHF